MNIADLLILVVLAVSLLVSLFRGLIREVFSILIWVVAVFAAFRLADPLSRSLEAMIELPSARVILAFSAVFVLVLIVGGLVAFLVSKLVDSTGLTSTDRLLGGVFGLARGVLIVVVAVMLARLTPFPADPWWRESRLLPPFEVMANGALAWLPEPLRELLDGQTEPEPISLFDLAGSERASRPSEEY